MFQRSAVELIRQLKLVPLTASARSSMRPRSVPGGSAQIGERVVVLRTIVEEFGGEVVSSTLLKRLVQLRKRQDEKADLWLQRVLGELEDCGAVTLEDAVGTGVIVRIEPFGVGLAYGPPTSCPPGWSVISSTLRD